MAARALDELGTLGCVSFCGRSDAQVEKDTKQKGRKTLDVLVFQVLIHQMSPARTGFEDVY